MLFALRDGEEHRLDVRGVPELELRGLDRESAAALITQARRSRRGARGAADARRAVRRQRARASSSCRRRCRPCSSPARSRLPRSLPLTPNVERLFLARVRRLPEPAQKVLSLVAAEESGRLAPVLRASRRSGIDGRLRLGRPSTRGSSQCATLASSSVIRWCDRRSCRVCRRTSAARRTWRLRAPSPTTSSFDERTWHLAAAAAGPDAELAGALETVAERARRRSAHAPAAGAFERAAELSPDPESSGRRFAAAAAAAWHAGQPGRASALLDRADALVGDRRLRADVVHLRGEIQLRCGVLIDACDILMAGADDVAPVDTRKALEMLIAAREAAGWAGDTPRTVETGRRAEALPPSEDPTTRFLADLLVGIGKLYEGETAVALPLVRDVVARAADFDEPSWVTWTAAGAQGLGDEVRAAELHERAIGLARASGAVDKLTYALLDLRADGAVRRSARGRRGGVGRPDAGQGGRSSQRAEQAPGDAQLVCARCEVTKTSAARRRRRRSRSPGPAAAPSRTRWRSGGWVCSRSAGAAASQAFTWTPYATRRRASGTLISGCCRLPTSSRPSCWPGAGIAPSRPSRRSRASRKRARRRGRLRSPPAAARCSPTTPSRVSPRRSASHADGDRRLDHARTLLSARRAAVAPRRRQRGARPAARCAGTLRGARSGGLGRPRARGAARRRRGGGPRPGPALTARTRGAPDGAARRRRPTRTARSPRASSARPGQSTRSCAECSPSSACIVAGRAGGLGLGTEPPTPLLRSRLARAGLGSCSATCGRSAARDLPEALARTVGDPELVVALSAPRRTLPRAPVNRSALPPPDRADRTRRDRGPGGRRHRRRRRLEDDGARLTRSPRPSAS